MTTQKSLAALAGLVTLGFLLSIQSAAQEQVKVDPIAAVEVKLGRPASLTQDVMPILEEKCQACHSSVLTEGRLLLEEYGQIMKGGKRGAAVVPGKAADSL